MFDNLPNVSVVLPVFNGEKYLKAAIESILKQTYTQFEFIIINDGSTDSTKQILLDYSDKDSRIKLIHQDNKGLVDSLNRGVSIAQGKYIARMDADDISAPERFELQVAFLEANPDYVAIGSDIVLIDDEARKLTTQYQLQDHESIQFAAFAGHCPICHPAALIRTDAILKSGLYNKEFYPAEDLDLWLRLSEIGLLGNLNASLLFYRMHGESISGVTANGGRQRDAMRRACEAAWSRRGLSNMRFEAHEAWRPDSSKEMQLAYMLKCGWWAFNSREYKTSLHYGWRALKHKQINKQAFILTLKSAFKIVRMAI